jgi:hypothetical protein
VSLRQLSLDVLGGVKTLEPTYDEGRTSMVVYCSRQIVGGLDLECVWFRKRMSSAFNSLPDTRGTPIIMQDATVSSKVLSMKPCVYPKVTRVLDLSSGGDHVELMAREASNAHDSAQSVPLNIAVLKPLLWIESVVSGLASHRSRRLSSEKHPSLES